MSAAPVVDVFRFDPNQPRNERGEWTSTGADASTALRGGVVVEDEYGTLEIRETGVDRIRQVVYEYDGGSDVMDVVVIENEDGTISIDAENLYGTDGTIEGERALETYLAENGIDDVRWDGERGTLHASHRARVEAEGGPVAELYTNVEDTYTGQFRNPSGESFTIGNTRIADRTAGKDPSVEITGEILDASGEKVGTFTRAVYADGVVYNHSLSIRPDRLGEGIGTAFLDQTEANLNAKEYRIGAVSVGKYAWAARGYRLDTSADRTGAAYVRDQWIDEARASFNDLPEEQVDRAEAVLRSWSDDIDNVYPADLIAVNSDAFRDMFLEGPSWDGVRRVDDDRLVATAGINVVQLASGMPAQLRDYWLNGEGAARIGWGSDGDFTRCVTALSEHVSDPQGICANLHFDANGFYPGDKRNLKNDGETAADEIVVFRFDPTQPRDGSGRWTSIGGAAGRADRLGPLSMNDDPDRFGDLSDLDLTDAAAVRAAAEDFATKLTAERDDDIEYRVRWAIVNDGSTTVSIDAYNPHTQVAAMTRLLGHDRGAVRSSSLDVDDAFQGQGVGTHMREGFEDFAASIGMREVQVGATNVGSYAWARAGYDWAPYTNLVDIGEAIRADAPNLAARFDSASDWQRGTPIPDAVPTPWEVSEALGSRRMIAAIPQWSGVKQLRRRSSDELAVEVFRFDPNQARDDDGRWTADGSGSDGLDGYGSIEDADGEILEVAAGQVAERFELDGGSIEVPTNDGGRLFSDSSGRYVTLEPIDGGTYVAVYSDLYEARQALDLTELETQVEAAWREEAASSIVFHGTRSDESAAAISADGLGARNETRGVNNRFVGSAIYTTTEYELARQYGNVFEIDLPRAIADGVVSAESLSREPGYNEADALSMIANSFEDYSFDAYSQFYGTGEDPTTVVISADVIPPQYLRYDEDGIGNFGLQVFRFDPSQPRDDSGRWTSTGGTDRVIEQRTNPNGETVYTHQLLDADGYSTATFSVTDAEDLWEPEQAEDAIEGLADAWEYAPTAGQPPRIEVLSASAAGELLADRGVPRNQISDAVESTYAFTLSNDEDIIVFIAGFDRPDPETGAWMPSSQDVSPERFTAAHEYGHIRMIRGDDDKALVKRTWAPLDLPIDVVQSVSAYGRTNSLEAHAEAFAEIVTTNGQTDNAFARYYDGVFGWSASRDEALAASAGDEVELPVVIGEGATGPVYVWADGRVDHQLGLQVFRFDPSQPRDESGKWTSGPSTNADGDTIDDVAMTIPERRDPDAILDEWMSSPEEFAAAQALAAEKARNVPRPTAEQIAKNREMLAKSKRPGGWGRGNSYTRRARAQALFAEFGGKPGGSCPCSHCGIKVSPGGEGGFARMTQDKILTAAEGGTYGTVASGFPNLIPSCGGCNSSRNQETYFVRPVWAEDGLAAAAGRNTDLTTAEELVAVRASGKPVGWDTWLEPEVGDARVEGEYVVRSVDTWFGPYQQHLIAGETCDPLTILVTPDEQLAVEVFRFNPGQPRDERGRWTSTGGTVSSSVIADIEAGEIVTVEPADVGTVVDQFRGRPGPIDLTAIQVAGHPHLFTGARANLTAREDMPQIPEVHLEGFKQELRSDGINLTETSIPATELRATQRELDAVATAEMAARIRDGSFTTRHRPWVSADGKVLDGHHRWTAHAVVELEGHPAAKPMDVIQVDLDMDSLLLKARAYNAEHGIDARRHGDHRRRLAARMIEQFGFDPTQPRDESGRWTDGGSNVATPDEDYRGGHRPSETGPRIHDLLESEMTDGLDVYENPQFFTGYARTELNETMAQLLRVQGDPDATVTIYRAAPVGAEINDGDWVTLSETYAQLHMDSGHAGDDAALISLDVPAKTVRWAVDDLMEYGYFPELGDQRIFSEDDLSLLTLGLEAFRFDPSQPRDGNGRWTSTGATRARRAGERLPDTTTPADRRGWRPVDDVDSDRPVEFDDYENAYRVFGADGRPVEARVFGEELRSPEWRQRTVDVLNGVTDGFDAAPTVAVPNVVVVDAVPAGLPDEADDSIAFVSYNGSPSGPPMSSAPYSADLLRPNTIVVNGSPSGREAWIAMGDATRHLMDSSGGVSLARYIGAHEFGHTRARASDPIRTINESFDQMVGQGTPQARERWRALSNYGKSNAAEAHAETFADFVITGGASTNPATVHYRSIFGWDDRQAFAAAAGATPLRDQWVIVIDSPTGGTLITKAPDGAEFRFDPNQPRDEAGRWTDGGATGGQDTLGEFSTPPPEYTEKAQAEWAAGAAYLAENDMPDWWLGLDYIDEDGLPVGRDQVAHDWSSEGISDRIDEWRNEVGPDVEAGVWMIGRAAEARRKEAIAEAISMNRIDVDAANERYGRDAEADRGQWEDLPDTLYHATSAMQAIAADGSLKTRREIGGRDSAAGLGGGTDNTISFTSDRRIAEDIARSLHEANRALNMPKDDLLSELQSRAGSWWPEVEESARVVHGSSDYESLDDRFNLYRSFAAVRERQEGVLDPLFFNVNAETLRDMNPADIGIVEVAPAVTGAKGYQVSALGEWRTPTGQATEITRFIEVDDPGQFSIGRFEHATFTDVPNEQLRVVRVDMNVVQPEQLLAQLRSGQDLNDADASVLVDWIQTDVLDGTETPEEALVKVLLLPPTETISQFRGWVDQPRDKSGRWTDIGGTSITGTPTAEGELPPPDPATRVPTDIREAAGGWRTGASVDRPMAERISRWFRTEFFPSGEFDVADFLLAAFTLPARIFFPTNPSRDDQVLLAADGLRVFRFDPGQPRDENGRWTSGVAQSAGALQEPDSGFTRAADRLEPITTGWAVALGGTDKLVARADAFTPDGRPTERIKRMLVDRIDAAMSTPVPDGTKRALGAWHNPADGLIEVNVTAVFPADQSDVALAFAQAEDQIAMANLDAISAGDWDNAIVNTGGTGGAREIDDDSG